MATITITHIGGSDGLYNGEALALSSVATVYSIDSLTMDIAAGKTYWADASPLTYTATVNNASDAPYAYEDIMFSTTIDIANVVLDEGSITLNGSPVAAHSYDSATGALSFSLGTVGIGGTAVATFQVTKA